MGKLNCLLIANEDDILTIRSDLSELKKIIDNWLFDSFSQFYTSFQDFLTPLYFGMIVVNDSIEYKL